MECDWMGRSEHGGAKLQQKCVASDGHNELFSIEDLEGDCVEDPDRVLSEALLEFDLDRDELDLSPPRTPSIGFNSGDKDRQEMTVVEQDAADLLPFFSDLVGGLQEQTLPSDATLQDINAEFSRRQQPTPQAHPALPPLNFSNHQIDMVDPIPSDYWTQAPQSATPQLPQWGDLSDFDFQHAASPFTQNSAGQYDIQDQFSPLSRDSRNIQPGASFPGASVKQSRSASPSMLAGETPRRRGRPRLYDTTASKESALGYSDTEAEYNQGPLKNKRGAKPKYRYRTEAEAVANRRERNRKTAISSYYKRKNKTQELEQEIQELEKEKKAMHSLLDYAHTTTVDKGAVARFLEHSRSGVETLGYLKQLECRTQPLF